MFKLVHDVITVTPKHRLTTECEEHRDSILTLKNLEMGKCALNRLHSQCVTFLLMSNGIQLCNKKNKCSNDFPKMMWQTYWSCCFWFPIYSKDVPNWLPLVGQKETVDLWYGDSFTQRLQIFTMHTTQDVQQIDVQIASCNKFWLPLYFMHFVWFMQLILAEL